MDSATQAIASGPATLHFAPLDECTKAASRLFACIQGEPSNKCSVGMPYLIIASGMLPIEDTKNLGHYTTYITQDAAVFAWVRAFHDYALPLYDSGRDNRLHWRVMPEMVEGSMRLGEVDVAAYRVYSRLVIVDHTRIAS